MNLWRKKPTNYRSMNKPELSSELKKRKLFNFAVYGDLDKDYGVAYLTPQETAAMNAAVKTLETADAKAPSFPKVFATTMVIIGALASTIEISKGAATAWHHIMNQQSPTHTYRTTASKTTANTTQTSTSATPHALGASITTTTSPPPMHSSKTPTSPPAHPNSTSTQPTNQTTPASPLTTPSTQDPTSPTGTNTPSNTQGTPTSTTHVTNVTVPYIVNETKMSKMVPVTSAGYGWYFNQCSATWNDGTVQTWNIGQPEYYPDGTTGSVGCGAPPPKST